MRQLKNYMRSKRTMRNCQEPVCVTLGARKCMNEYCGCWVDGGINTVPIPVEPGISAIGFIMPWTDETWWIVLAPKEMAGYPGDVILIVNMYGTDWFTITKDENTYEFIKSVGALVTNDAGLFNKTEQILTPETKKIPWDISKFITNNYKKVSQAAITVEMVNEYLYNLLDDSGEVLWHFDGYSIVENQLPLSAEWNALRNLIKWQMWQAWDNISAPYYLAEEFRSLLSIEIDTSVVYADWEWLDWFLTEKEFNQASYVLTEYYRGKDGFVKNINWRTYYIEPTSDVGGTFKVQLNGYWFQWWAGLDENRVLISEFSYSWVPVDISYYESNAQIVADMYTYEPEDLKAQIGERWEEAYEDPSHHIFNVTINWRAYVVSVTSESSMNVQTTIWGILYEAAIWIETDEDLDIYYIAADDVKDLNTDLIRNDFEQITDQEEILSLKNQIEEVWECQQEDEECPQFTKTINGRVYTSTQSTSESSCECRVEISWNVYGLHISVEEDSDTGFYKIAIEDVEIVNE